MSHSQCFPTFFSAGVIGDGFAANKLLLAFLLIFLLWPTVLLAGNKDREDLRAQFEAANYPGAQRINGDYVRYANIAFDDYKGFFSTKRIEHYKFYIKEDRNIVSIKIRINLEAYQKDHKDATPMGSLAGIDYMLDAKTGKIIAVQRFK